MLGLRATPRRAGQTRPRPRALDGPRCPQAAVLALVVIRRNVSRQRAVTPLGGSRDADRRAPGGPRWAGPDGRPTSAPGHRGWPARSPGAGARCGSRPRTPAARAAGAPRPGRGHGPGTRGARCRGSARRWRAPAVPARACATPGSPLAAASRAKRGPYLASLRASSDRRPDGREQALLPSADLAAASPRPALTTGLPQHGACGGAQHPVRMTTGATTGHRNAGATARYGMGNS